MADLHPEARAALAYWGIIERASREHLPTAELWDLIHEAAENLGLEAPGVTARGVQMLRGVAGRVQETARQLDRTPPNQQLESRHIAEVPWARTAQEQNALSMHQVRFQHTTLTPAGPETNWRSVVITGQLPGTISDLMTAIEGDAVELSRKYGGDHMGISDVQVLAI